MKALAVKIGKSRLKTDLVDETRKYVIEDKGMTTRESVRMASGQVLDCAFLLGRERGGAYRPVILLPARPAQSLIDLMQKLEIIVVLPDGDRGFIELVGSPQIEKAAIK